MLFNLTNCFGNPKKRCQIKKCLLTMQSIMSIITTTAKLWRANSLARNNHWILILFPRLFDLYSKRKEKKNHWHSRSWLKLNEVLAKLVFRFSLTKLCSMNSGSCWGEAGCGGDIEISEPSESSEFWRTRIQVLLKSSVIKK